MTRPVAKKTKRRDEIFYFDGQPDRDERRRIIKEYGRGVKIFIKLMASCRIFFKIFNHQCTALIAMMKNDESFSNGRKKNLAMTPLGQFTRKLQMR